MRRRDVLSTIAGGILAPAGTVAFVAHALPARRPEPAKLPEVDLFMSLAPNAKPCEEVTIPDFFSTVLSSPAGYIHIYGENGYLISIKLNNGIIADCAPRAKFGL